MLGGGRVYECVLASRAVLRISGSEAIKFLQGLVTKDVTPLSIPDAAPLYAALLNTKGRLVSDLLLHREAGPSSNTAVLMDCPAASAAQLRSNFTRFRLRSDVQIEDASADLRIVARWSLGSPSISDINLPDPPDLPPDPRHTQLGARGPVQLADWSDPETPPYTGQLIGVDAATERDYTALRYMLGIAEGPSEIPTGAAIPLEYNVDLLQGVTFDKGCYLGQELVARTHYQGLVRKRVLPVTLEPACTSAETQHACVGAQIFARGKTRAIGTLRGCLGKLEIGRAHV